MESREKGLSLVELMVAMVVTLIISGAVFQLVTAGQPAFRKEPAIADRQQSIRVAIDLISQDIYRTGYGVPEFAQVFRRGLNASGTMGFGGAATDQLEMVVTGDCVVRYRINVDADGVPNLERSPLGGANDSGGKSSWQVLARGVEDLQVQYETGPAAARVWSDDPGATSDADTLVRRVRVRLSAPSTEQGLTRQSTSPGAGNAVRGALEVAVAPRAAMATLGMANGEL